MARPAAKELTERELEVRPIEFPEPVMSFAVSPKAKGDEEKTLLAEYAAEDEASAAAEAA